MSAAATTTGTVQPVDSPEQAGSPDPGRCPYLVVRDPDVVREALHRPADFSPANALVAVTPLAGPALRVLQRVRFALPPVLASNDTDTHAGIRKVVAGFFTPATVAAMEPRIRELAREAAGKASAQLDSSGQVDLVQAVAAFPPAVVMLELLGLPVRDLGALKKWGLDSMELFWGWPEEDRQLALATAPPISTSGFGSSWLNPQRTPGETCSNPWPNTASPPLRSARWATSCSSPGRKQPPS